MQSLALNLLWFFPRLPQQILEELHGDFHWIPKLDWLVSLRISSNTKMHHQNTTSYGLVHLSLYGDCGKGFGSAAMHFYGKGLEPATELAVQPPLTINMFQSATALYTFTVSDFEQ